MSTVLGVLLVGILVLVYCTSCHSESIHGCMRRLKSIVPRKSASDCGCAGSNSSSSSSTPEGMSVEESTRVVEKLGGVFNLEDVASKVKPYAPGMGDQYDPINMGALKQTEIDAHKRGIAEMAPFNSYGPSTKVVRDDDDIMRNTGVPWVGGKPRSFRQIPSGPQAGARQAPSASEKDIYGLHVMSMNAPTW